MLILWRTACQSKEGVVFVSNELEKRREMESPRVAQTLGDRLRYVPPQIHTASSPPAGSNRCQQAPVEPPLGS
ncbi:hypothetical protein CORC01_06315 [Colletotrichum orchidophilum]|uniref:Uncharacterized protein n=1 Tax=Colletotrichum orchidophilum TaxID=1209926 RepID=A0A1G4BA80_9PEZI|nr:uncharacterized protein CORC01_06315 [Colletotrichum orchidophilum]OHE98319.1 hypothetical protein CORC01_06315 [Colletotrichum orchidophilum]